MTSNFTPRLNVDISEESYIKLRKLLPHGTRKLVINALVEDLIRLMETYGSGQIVGAVINRDLGIKEVCKITLGEGDKDDN